MGRLGEMFDRIEAKLVESLHEVGEPIPSFGRGLAAAAEYKSMPSIVMAPIKGDGRAPRAPAGHVKPDGAGGWITVSDPPAMWDRSLQVAARVYTADIDAANDLAERLVEAVEDCYGGLCLFEGEDWDTSRKVAAGTVLVLFFRLPARFERVPLRTRVPNTMELTDALVTELST